MKLTKIDRYLDRHFNTILNVLLIGAILSFLSLVWFFVM